MHLTYFIQLQMIQLQKQEKFFYPSLSFFVFAVMKEFVLKREKVKIKMLPCFHDIKQHTCTFAFVINQNSSVIC